MKELELAGVKELEGAYILSTHMFSKMDVWLSPPSHLFSIRAHWFFAGFLSAYSALLGPLMIISEALPGHLNENTNTYADMCMNSWIQVVYATQLVQCTYMYISFLYFIFLAPLPQIESITLKCRQICSFSLSSSFRHQPQSDTRNHGTFCQSQAMHMMCMRDVLSC